MFQFIESICIENGIPSLLDLHQARLERTFYEYYPGKKPHVLSECMPTISLLEKTKCRVIYNEEAVKVESAKYALPQITSLQVVESDLIDYTFKFYDRGALSELLSQKGSCDDILIVKNGFVTDCYFANIVFHDGEQWLTPENPLLKGVKRQKLIEEKKIKAAPIMKSDIRKFNKCSLINAMMDLGELCIETENIYE